MHEINSVKKLMTLLALYITTPPVYHFLFYHLFSAIGVTGHSNTVYWKKVCVVKSTVVYKAVPVRLMLPHRYLYSISHSQININVYIIQDKYQKETLYIQYNEKRNMIFHIIEEIKEYHDEY